MSGCAPSEGGAGLAESARNACAAAVAEHVGRGVEAVTAGPAIALGSDGYSVAILDEGGAGGERLHSCETDGAGRVLAITHV